MTVQPIVRMARASDLDSFFALAELTGGGMTNLPHDRDWLAEKIAWSERSLAASLITPEDEFYMLALEDQGSGRVIGTASLYSRLGARWPFYSYKISRVTHVSHDLERSFSTQVLHLVNDFDGASEVGGLFIHPEARSGGLGALLARSRYMFIARHRERFSDRVVAELRGWTENGISPFWEAVGKPFFGGDFYEADRHNALHGNQFIADLMPRYPIYATMLPQAAREAIARPHEGSVPAQKMLEAEGFAFDSYIDIFDGGPTMSARTDQIRTIRKCHTMDAPELGLRSEIERPLLASGEGADFHVRYAP
jgi:arginine N-succinyltransferase